MIKRSLIPALLCASIAGAILPATIHAQETATLALNTVSTAPVARNSWRLTLEFGRSDRSSTASARSVRAPALMAHDLIITGPDGLAAAFIVQEVGAPNGNKITALIEYFGAQPFVDTTQYEIRVLGDDQINRERDSTTFDFLPPSLAESGN